MADSWEDIDEQPHAQASAERKAPAGGLNPNASSFSFNPSASTFTPSFAPKPQDTTAPAQPIQESSAPSAAQSYEQQQPHHADTNGFIDHKQDAQPMHVDPPSERDTPVTSASTPAHHTDEHMQEADASSATAESHVESVTADVADLKVSKPSPSPSNPAPDTSTSAAAAPAHKHDDMEQEEETETAEDRAKRVAELSKIHADLAKEDDREHMNIVFIGHVDAGKSTIGGQILYLTGGVDERTIQKYEKEAKEKNRESWYMAYIMDTNEEERAKGKTVEVGRAHFETKKKRYTVLDAPGHKNYVPNMIGGAAQADVGVLVIAARKGEFETGFERGGQTREHAQLAKTLGVAKLIVAINKMDDESTTGPDGLWSEERYTDIKEKLTPFLRSCGYNPKKDLVFLPISGLLGDNIMKAVDPKKCPWYRGGTLFEILDATDPLPRDPLSPFRMSIIDKYKDMGAIAMGKSEAGIVRKGDKLFLMPNKVPVTVTTIYRDDNEVQAAKGGENLRLRLGGVDEDEVSPGFVLCSRHLPVPAVTYFDAQLHLLDLLEHKSLFSAGYKAILHIHAAVEECEITALLAQIDPKTKQKKKVKFVKGNTLAMARIQVEKLICVEKFENVPQLGRFTLRDEGRTIAVGKIERLPKSAKA